MPSQQQERLQCLDMQIKKNHSSGAASLTFACHCGTAYVVEKIG
jgi:hypothetical protein